MLNEFLNGFEQFKKRIDELSDEEIIKECIALGMEFEPITEKKSIVLSGKKITRKKTYNIRVSNNRNTMQLIA